MYNQLSNCRNVPWDRCIHFAQRGHINVILIQNWISLNDKDVSAVSYVTINGLGQLDAYHVIYGHRSGLIMFPDHGNLNQTTIYQEITFFAALNSGGNRVDLKCSRMMTSSNGNLFRVTGHLCRKLLKKLLSKPSRHRWFETLSGSLWRLFDGWFRHSWVFLGT